jgi:hypothetical protein
VQLNAELRGGRCEGDPKLVPKISAGEGTQTKTPPRILKSGLSHLGEILFAVAGAVTLACTGTDAGGAIRDRPDAGTTRELTGSSGEVSQFKNPVAAKYMIADFPVIFKITVQEDKCPDLSTWSRCALLTIMPATFQPMAVNMSMVNASQVRSSLERAVVSWS